MQLARMQDIGGLRAVVSSIQKVEELRQNYKASAFAHELVGEKDYILEPKGTGYRGVHLIYRYKNKQVADYDGLHIELQFRTRLQHTWATSVETMGTFLNYSLKSSEGPDEWLRFFSLAASAFAHMEKCQPVPGYEHLSREETYDAVLNEAERLDVYDRLQAFSIAAQQITNDNSAGSHHLVVLRPSEKTVQIYSYGRRRLAEATEKYTEFEAQAEGGIDLQVVLVATGSIAALRQAYPSYFLDTQEFLKVLRRLRKLK